MTQKNIDIMDAIVDRMISGKKLSEALKIMYTKRNVQFPYFEHVTNKNVRELGMSVRTTNSLLRAKLRTIGDVVDFCGTKKITEVNNFGMSSGVELFETILDLCWSYMTTEERTEFLIDTIERNSKYLRKEFM